MQIHTHTHTHVLAHTHANIHACRHSHTQAHARMQTLLLFHYTLVDRTKICYVTKPVSAASVAEEFSLQSFMRVLCYINTATVLFVSVTESVNIRNTAVCIYSCTLPRAPHRHSHQSIHASISWHSTDHLFFTRSSSHPTNPPSIPHAILQTTPLPLTKPLCKPTALCLKETYIQIR